MIRQLACLMFLLAGITAQAHAQQGCPYPSAVKYVDGFFQASDSQTLWQSSKVDFRDFADRFIGALFLPGKGQERENGYLDRCVYRMGNGQAVALRYEAGSQAKTMSLTPTLHWQLTRDALNQDVYICQDIQPDNCSFTVGKLN